MSENILKAADAIIVPTIPTTLSLRTLDQILNFCEKIKCRTIQDYAVFFHGR